MFGSFSKFFKTTASPTNRPQALMEKMGIKAKTKQEATKAIDTRIAELKEIAKIKKQEREFEKVNRSLYAERQQSIQKTERLHARAIEILTGSDIFKT